MKTVGIRELKTRLSQVLRDVAAGEVFLVTDRGHVIAELRQPGSSLATASPQERALARLVADGQLRIAESPKAFYRRSPLKLPKGTAQRLIDEDRGGPK